MKQIVFMLCLVALITGCKKIDKENLKNKELQQEAIRAAESSKDNISDLPLDFVFGMTQNEVNENLKDLQKNKIVDIDGPYKCYDYVLESGDVITSNLNFDFDEDCLYRLSFSLYTYNQWKDIDNDISSRVDTVYKRISYYEYNDKFDKDTTVYTCWIRGNQYIQLRYKGYSGTLEFVNAPIKGKLFNAESKKYLEEAMRKDENGSTKNTKNKKEKNLKNKVENSAWDGSVFQVKRFLKRNLNNPGSYESIEWGNVKKTSEGYAVRHKYRAKNGFGGYVVEDQVFYLDFEGNVTNVSSY
jgi:hypothetical protein